MRGRTGAKSVLLRMRPVRSESENRLSRRRGTLRVAEDGGVTRWKGLHMGQRKKLVGVLAASIFVIGTMSVAMAADGVKHASGGYAGADVASSSPNSTVGSSATPATAPGMAVGFTIPDK